MSALAAAGRKQLAWERRQQLMAFLRTHKSASVTALGELVNASPATVHRDLDLLSKKGLVARVHGGALLVEAHDDPPMAWEKHARVEEKQRIAQTAAREIDDSVQSIFLEASTTVALLVPLLRHMQDRIFVTNGPEIALELVAGEAEVILVGGNLRQRTLSTVGPLALAGLETLRVDLLFAGVSAIDDRGLTSMNTIEAATKSAIIAASDRIVALGDGQKLGRRGLVPVAPLSAVSRLITDANAPAEQIARLRSKGLDVVVAGGTSGS